MKRSFAALASVPAGDSKVMLVANLDVTVQSFLQMRRLRRYEGKAPQSNFTLLEACGEETQTDLGKRMIEAHVAATFTPARVSSLMEQPVPGPGLQPWLRPSPCQTACTAEW